MEALGGGIQDLQGKGQKEKVQVGLSDEATPGRATDARVSGELSIMTSQRETNV